MKVLALLSVIGSALVVLSFPAVIKAQGQAPSGYDLLAAVNALRASHGLSPYGVDPLLMLSSQMQADYLASQAPGPVSGHIGPGGSDADARARAVGFPYITGLDINENWAAIPVGTTFEAIFNGVWGDSTHQHTLLHPRGQLAGAGIAVSGDTMYIILDVAAYWGDAGKTPWPTSSVIDMAGGTPVISQYIVPVQIATPLPNGSIVHQVQSGQSLWSIAIKYGVTIDTIRKLNGIATDNTIYIGQKLIIQEAGKTTPTSLQKTETLSLADFLPPKARANATLNPSHLTSTSSQPFKVDPSGIFLILFVLAGTGLVLVFIGLRH